MPRRLPKEPWYWSAQKVWCAVIDGTRHRLGQDYADACRQLKELVRRQIKQDARRRVGDRSADFAYATFRVLADEYLEHVKATRSERHHDGQEYRLQVAERLVLKGIFARDVRRYHLAKLQASMVHGGYSTTTIADVLSSVKAVFGWATQMDLFDFDPVARFPVPRRGERQRVVTDDEFRRLLRKSGPNFRRFLIAMRLTGARPKELRELKPEHIEVDKDAAYIVLHRHKTADQTKEQKARVIPLVPLMVRLLKWCEKNRPPGCENLFWHQRGGPYSKDVLARSMARARDRAGITDVNGEKLVVYHQRHGVATAAIGKVSDHELAEFLGHSSTRMLRRYVHMSKNHLKGVAERMRLVVPVGMSEKV